MLRCLSVLLVVALLPAHAALAETTAAPPVKAYFLLAQPGGDVQLVWLAPVGAVPDAYRVYGYDGVTATLLAETVALSAAVPGGYANYAVTAVYGPTESAPKPADACFSLAATLPPQVGIDPNGCL